MTQPSLANAEGRRYSRFESIGYGLCMRGGWISDLWSKIWYRWYCPYPIIDDHSARACIKAGCCGCNNLPTNPTDGAS